MLSSKQFMIFLMILTLRTTEVLSIKCIVCSDCENYYNDTHLIECEKTEERCLTINLANGETERACGSKDSCTRMEAPTPKPAKVKKREEFTNNIPKKRTVRDLLQQKLPEKVEPKEIPEFTSIHCCKEDECNSAISNFNVDFRTFIFINTIILRNLLHHSTFCIFLTFSILSHITL